MKKAKVLFGVLALLTFGLAEQAFAVTGPNVGLRRCLKQSTIGANSASNLTTNPAIVCSVDLVGSTGSGTVTVWDSPDGTSTHAQATVVAEPGVTGASGFSTTGKVDRLTRYGLFVETNGGVTAIVDWDD